MNYILIDNIHALMDDNEMPKGPKTRAKYLAKHCDTSVEEIELFFIGEGGLSKGILKKIADLFEVDIHWLAGSY
tara:strand:+ start:9563 stop:9784 length:222 start_codon:yes stop_codon:yes gene_type:complete